MWACAAATDLVGGIGTDERLGHRSETLGVRAGDDGFDDVVESLEVRGRLVTLGFGNDGRHVQVSLAPEVAGDQRGVDAGVVADVSSRRVLEAALTEERPRRFE